MTERYRVEPTGCGFWPFRVVAGDGTRELFIGHSRSCERVAAELITAFRDGEFVGKRDYDALHAEAEALRGLTPELPPRPPEGAGLPRYGLRRNGPSQPLSVPMDDGYWTPWHLAEALRAENEQLRDSTKRIDAYWQSELRDCRNERDTLTAELEAARGLLREVRHRCQLPDWARSQIDNLTAAHRQAQRQA